MHSFIPHQLPQSSVEVIIRLLFCLEPVVASSNRSSGSFHVARWREQPLHILISQPWLLQAAPVSLCISSIALCPDLQGNRIPLSPDRFRAGLDDSLALAEEVPCHWWPGPAVWHQRAGCPGTGTPLPVHGASLWQSVLDILFLLLSLSFDLSEFKHFSQTSCHLPVSLAVI